MYPQQIIRFLNKTVAVLAVTAVFFLTFDSQAYTTDKPIRTAPDKDIVETAISAKQFNTLVAAVQAAGLVETLQGDGPFTVFAPTDEAFAKLPAGTVESLLKPENKDQLVAILTYHVVAGKVMSGDVVGLSSAKTAQGDAISISTKGKNVMINESKVVAVDIEATNGVIHVIDTVLLPPTK